jgi:hypothetical protein
VSELSEYFPFIEDRIDRALGEDPRFGHLFHREELLVLLPLNFPNLSEASLPNGVRVNEVVFIHSNIHLYNSD